MHDKNIFLINEKKHTISSHKDKRRVSSLGCNPLISIITVVLNGAKHIENTIKSILCQDYNNYEFIIIDGCSSDETLDIVRKYEHGIDYWTSEPDNGIYDAMNKGINLSSGEWVYFLNCGDTFVNKYVLREIGKELSNSKYSVLVGRVYAISGNKVASVFPTRFPTGLSARTFFKTHFCHQAIFVKKALYANFDGFSQRYRFFSDFYTILSIIRYEGGYSSVERVVANFNLEGFSSNWKYAIEIFRESERIFEEFGESLKCYKYYLYLAKATCYRFKMLAKKFL